MDKQLVYTVYTTTRIARGVFRFVPPPEHTHPVELKGNRSIQVGDEELRDAMAELSKKLGLFESVRHVCHAVQIPLPGVVVVGEQSAGKSSLLESISGIQFPRAQNTCTRMPCVLTMLTDPTVDKPFALVSMDASFADVAA